MLAPKLLAVAGGLLVFVGSLVAYGALPLGSAAAGGGGFAASSVGGGASSSGESAAVAAARANGGPLVQHYPALPLYPNFVLPFAPGTPSLEQYKSVVGSRTYKALDEFETAWAAANGVQLALGSSLGVHPSPLHAWSRKYEYAAAIQVFELLYPGGACSDSGATLVDAGSGYTFFPFALEYMCYNSGGRSRLPDIYAVDKEPMLSLYRKSSLVRNVKSKGRRLEEEAAGVEAAQEQPLLEEVIEPEQEVEEDAAAPAIRGRALAGKKKATKKAAKAKVKDFMEKLVVGGMTSLDIGGQESEEGVEEVDPAVAQFAGGGVVAESPPPAPPAGSESGLRLLPVNFIKSDLDNMAAFMDKTVDVIFCIGMLEPVSPSRRAALLAEFYRVLKPGGVLMISYTLERDGDIGLNDAQHRRFINNARQLFHEFTHYAPEGSKKAPRPAAALPSPAPAAPKKAAAGGDRTKIGDLFGMDADAGAGGAGAAPRKSKSGPARGPPVPPDDDSAVFTNHLADPPEFPSRTLSFTFHVFGKLK